MRCVKYKNSQFYPIKGTEQYVNLIILLFDFVFTRVLMSVTFCEGPLAKLRRRFLIIFSIFLVFVKFINAFILIDLVKKLLSQYF